MKQLIDVQIPMRDGVRLSADIRMPAGAGPFPSLLVRSPYGNVDPKGFRGYVDAGYAVVEQDCRGRFDSHGRFNPFHEAEDGCDTLAWMRAQPWCDGRLGMFAGSYLGYTQLSAAWLRPPGLRAIVPRVMGCDLFKDLIYYNGVFNLGLALGWALGTAGRSGQSNPTTDWPALYRHLPLAAMDEAAGYDLPHFKAWMAHPVYDDYWKATSIESHYAEYDLPILHVGGWFDIFAEGTLRNYEGIRRHGGPVARKHQKLIMGPWPHTLGGRCLGQLDFGGTAIVDLDAIEARWLAHWVRGVKNGIEKEAPVRIFVMGANVWRDEQAWPLARARNQAWHLGSGGRANSLHGDGILTKGRPCGSKRDAFVYNPDNPVPSVGGCLAGEGVGPQDHAPIERRDDVLVYTGPRLERPLEVTGYVKAILHVESDARDTDFIARLCDVYPDGRSLIVCDGILRARFREGLDREVMLNPGRVCEIEVGMGATSIVFQPGHRLRLEITSSCFPRFARNLNTGEPSATGTRMRCAIQTVHHSRAHPSRLVLPVVPASSTE